MVKLRVRVGVCLVGNPNIVIWDGLEMMVFFIIFLIEQLMVGNLALVTFHICMHFIQ